MRKALMCLIAVASLLGLYGVSTAQTKPADFSGTWMLDKSKTPDIPPTVESYTLTVTQDEQHIVVETSMKGDLPMRRGPGGGGRGGGFPGGGGGGRGGGGGGGRGGGGGGGFGGGGGAGEGGGGGGGGFPGGGGGGGGFGGGPGGFGMPKDMVMAMALRTTFPKASYTLDGKEAVTQIEPRPASEGQPPQGGGSIALKANLKKNGKVLELQVTRKFKNPEGLQMMTTKDRWELSEDGKTMSVKRTIESISGGEEAKMVFTRQ